MKTATGLPQPAVERAVQSLQQQGILTQSADGRIAVSEGKTRATLAIARGQTTAPAVAQGTALVDGTPIPRIPTDVQQAISYIRQNKGPIGGTVVAPQEVADAMRVPLAQAEQQLIAANRAGKVDLATEYVAGRGIVPTYAGLKNEVDYKPAPTIATANQVEAIKQRLDQEINKPSAPIGHSLADLRQRVPAPDRQAFDDAVGKLRAEGKIDLVPVSDQSTYKREYAGGIQATGDVSGWAKAKAKLHSEVLAFDCGSGAGGFHAGNTCAKGSAGAGETAGSQLHTPAGQATADAPALADSGPARAPTNIVMDPIKHEEAQKFFGQNLSKEHIAAMANAPDGARIITNRYGDKLQVSVNHPGMQATRTFGRDATGALVVHNDYFKIKDTLPNGSANPLKVGGKGAELFSNQVRALETAGVVRINTDAAGCSNCGMNGYYTWPRLGFEAGIPKDLVGQMPPALQAQVGAEGKISSLMKTSEGQTWWRAKGADLDKATFDVRAGSPSRQALSKYLNEKKASK